MKTISETVRDSVWNLLENPVQSPVNDSVWGSVSNSLGSPIWRSIQTSMWEPIHVWDIAGSLVERRTRELQDEKE